jgi:hypothetical protein
VLTTRNVWRGIANLFFFGADADADADFSEKKNRRELHLGKKKIGHTDFSLFFLFFPLWFVAFSRIDRDVKLFAAECVIVMDTSFLTGPRMSYSVFAMFSSEENEERVLSSI